MSGGLKILLVSNAFFPEISPRSYRATELAKEFCRQGHEVVVITKFRGYDYGEFLKETPIIVKTWRGDRFPSFRDAKRKPWALITRGIKRLLLLLFEYPAIEDMFHVRKMLKKEIDYDIMISFAVPYPVQWGVAWARKSKRQISRVWVADCGDPYMGDVLDSFRKPFYFSYLEKNFCRKTDYISIPVESAISAYYPEFHHKIRIIPQGFEFDLGATESNRQPREIPEFAYAGKFLHGIRDPGPLLEFLSRTEVPFRFYIFTDQPEYLEEYRSRLKDRIIISGYISRNDLLKKLSEMDFLVNFDNNTTLNIPSKLIDYSITGRPVLNIRKDFSAEDIKAFLKGDYTRRMNLPDPIHYHISNISAHFLGLINTTA